MSKRNYVYHSFGKCNKKANWTTQSSAKGSLPENTGDWKKLWLLLLRNPFSKYVTWTCLIRNLCFFTVKFDISRHAFTFNLRVQMDEVLLAKIIFSFRTWQNGKAIVIDDSFDHEVWHNGTKQRLILIVDFWHPDVPDWERQSLPAI